MILWFYYTQTQTKRIKLAVEPVLAQLDELEKHIASRFARLEALEAALAYIKGLISAVARKNSWQLAEAIGDRNPYRFQHLLNCASWDVDAVRDDLRDYVVEHLERIMGRAGRKCGTARLNRVS